MENNWTHNIAHTPKRYPEPTCSLLLLPTYSLFCSSCSIKLWPCLSQVSLPLSWTLLLTVDFSCDSQARVPSKGLKEGVLSVVLDSAFLRNLFALSVLLRKSSSLSACTTSGKTDKIAAFTGQVTYTS